MNKVAFFDCKPYDKVWFDKINEKYGFDIVYFENKLNESTALMARDFEVAVAFVNDQITSDTIDALHSGGTKLLAMRCTGYSNVDLKAAKGKISVVRVPNYSPYSVAEHAVALLLCINRKIHKAYNRTRDMNFSIDGLIGFDLYGKTLGVIGTGKIGKVFINICKSFGLNVIAYDPYPSDEGNINYVSKEEVFSKSDIISLHCPLTRDTHHIINKDSIEMMKDGVYIINTSRGGLINSEDLLNHLLRKKIGGAALDVYEEESDIFFEDFSDSIMQDNILTHLLSLPNVLITSHQAFFTVEAMENIANITLNNIYEYFNNQKLSNEIYYK